MTDQHPITPPLELVQQWSDSSPIQHSDESWAYELFIADQAARWGSDQELEACIELLKADGYKALASPLRAARRPKPPSLKAQALEAMHRNWNPHNNDDFATIRRALEALND